MTWRAGMIRGYTLVFTLLAIGLHASAAQADEVADAATVLESSSATEMERIEARKTIALVGGVKAAAAVNALVATLGKPDPLRYHAGRALVAIGPPAIPSLRLAFTIGSGELRNAALHLWAEIDSDAHIDVLRDRLGNSSPAVRAEAALLLGYRDPEQKTSNLLAKTRDQDADQDVKSICAESIGLIDARIAILLDSAQQEAKVRRHFARAPAIWPAANAVAGADAKHPEPATRFDEIVLNATRGQGDVQLEAIETLGKFGGFGYQVVPILKTLLNSPAFEVKWATAQALGQVGADSVPVWLDAIKSNDWVKRRLAFAALGDANLPVRPEDRPAIEKALAGQLAEPDPSALAADALCSYWPTSAALIVKLLKDGNVTLRNEVVSELLGNPHCFEVYQKEQRKPLSHKDWYALPTRELSVEFTRQVEPALLRTLAQGNETARFQAFVALRALPTDLDEVTRTLLRSMGGDDPQRAKQAGEMLAGFSKGSLPALVAGVRGGDAGLRLACARVLAGHEMSTQDPAAVEAMTAALADRSAEVRHAALPWAARLALASPAAISHLAATILPGEFHADLPADRAIAVKAIANIAAEPDISMPAVLAALNDADPDVQEAAIVAVRSFAAARQAALAIPRLRVLAGENRMRRPASDTLALLGPEGRRLAAPILLDALRKAADDADRLAAIKALGFLGPEAAPAAPELEKLLAGSDNALRITVANTLGAIGPAARPAVPALTRMVDNRRADVRRAAAAALVYIAPDGAGLSLALVAAVENADPASAALLANALRQRDDRWVLVRRLQNLAEEDPESAIRAAARRAVDALSPDLPGNATRPVGG